MQIVNGQRPLTPDQKKVLDFINQFLLENGYPPSLSEIARHFRKSIGTSQHFVRELREKGYVTKGSNISRGAQPTSFESRKIFLLGYIAAGRPIEPIENPELVSVPSSILMDQWGNYYALRVRGTSMIGEGIIDNDIIVVRHQNIAQNGDIVVVVTNNGATLKKFYKLGDKVELRAGNKKMRGWPRQFHAGNLEIRGKFCGLIRKD